MCIAYQNRNLFWKQSQKMNVWMRDIRYHSVYSNRFWLFGIKLFIQQQSRLWNANAYGNQMRIKFLQKNKASLKCTLASKKNIKHFPLKLERSNKTIIAALILIWDIHCVADYLWRVHHHTCMIHKLFVSCVASPNVIELFFSFEI